MLDNGHTIPHAPPIHCLSGDPDDERISSIIWDLGYCGSYLHYHRGGRSGKAPILLALLVSGGTLTQRELCRSFNVTAASLSEMLTKMENEGLVERSRDPEDSRRLIVSMTERGRELADEERVKRREFRKRALSCLTVSEQENLLEYLDRICKHWEDL